MNADHLIPTRTLNRLPNPPLALALSLRRSIAMRSSSETRQSKIDETLGFGVNNPS
jgi:hypothetical protein